MLFLRSRNVATGVMRDQGGASISDNHRPGPPWVPRLDGTAGGTAWPIPGRKHMLSQVDGLVWHSNLELWSYGSCVITSGVSEEMGQTATAFDSVPGTAVSLSGRDWKEYVPKSLSTPFERTETVLLSALATKSSPSQSADTQTAVCPVRALRFYIDRSASFWQSIQLLDAMVGVRRAKPYRNKVCHTRLWMLSRRHIQPKVWKMPSAH